VEVEDVLQCFQNPPLHHLVEFELVTVKHLVSKITESFKVSSSGDYDVAADLVPGQYGPLPETPVFLVGVLHCSDVLRFADATGEIACQVG
jgi:hypothetical protein